MTNQEYTITMDTENKYTVPAFETDPPNCPVTYSYTLPGAESVVESFGPTTGAFEFMYTDDLTLCGLT